MLESQEKFHITEKLHELNTEKEKDLISSLEKEGFSSDEIENIKKTHLAKIKQDEQMEAIRNAIHNEYDTKVHKTKKDIEEHHYIEDLEKIKQIKIKFDSIKKHQENVPFWRIDKILQAKRLRRELANQYNKLTKAISDYEYKKSREELFK